jgi:chromosome segregation protein
MAEVVLTFDTSDGSAPPAFQAWSEVQIARRLYRTGESEYLINRTPCRLRDVQDFFRDAGVGTKGYTIVEQGRIAEIVSAKPEERRILIEEAAGIGKYKARRREAESKIESTRQNLLRVNDVLAEIRRQINAIERQARKAERYKRLRETTRILELSLAADDRAALAAQIETAQRRGQELRGERVALEARVAERELALETRRIEQAECERALSQGNEVLLGLRGEIKECEGRIGFARRERESLRDTASARREELAQLRQQLAAQQQEAARAGDELRTVEVALASEREGVRAAEDEARRAKAGLEALERERDAANAALVECLTRVARGEDRLAAVENRRAVVEAALRHADEELEVGHGEVSRADREQRELEQGLRNLLAERDRMMGLLRAALDTHERAAAAAREASEAWRAACERRETRRARLESLAELVSGHADLDAGARFLLTQAGDAGRFGLRGLVRDFLEVEPGAEPAVEAVLAERAGALVAETQSGALAALSAVRAAGAGRGVFVALPPPELEPTGFVPLGQPLLARVRARPGYEDLARRLLGAVNLVADLREVVEVYGDGRAPATFVTPAGDVLTPDGVMRGGLDTGAGALARRQEIRALEQEVQALEADAERAERAQREAEAALARASDELENLRNRHHTAALAVANHEKDLERTKERIKSLGEVQEGRAASRSERLAEAEALAGEGAGLGTSLAEARGQRAERQRAIDALVLRIGAAGRELTRLETTATERRVEHAGREEKRERLSAGFERARGAASETAEWIARREAEIRGAEARSEELARLVEETQQRLEQCLVEEERARAGFEAGREVFERAAAAVTEIEAAVRELRGEVAARREAGSAVELALRETELRAAHLEQSIRDRWQVELASWTLPPLEPEAEDAAVAAEPAAEAEPAPVGVEPDADGEPAPDAAREARRNALLARLPRVERQTELEALRGKLQALGEVNLGAIEEHEELSERFRFLSEQRADLDATLASLQDAIARINRVSRRRFRETFEEVSKRFSENFPRLFRGGKAGLALTESEDVLEAGIEIMASPPGKRLQNVNLLSGGEKTLTAIALLVSVFQVRPSPFFLLDEVDAALDDANVGRFNEIVRELSQDSQFVLITHNKRTIEVADVLYGITMERKGISKLVSVEVH